MPGLYDDETVDLLKALARDPGLKLAVDERPEAGIPFRLESDYRPSGDQPQAIAELIEGVRERRQGPGPARGHRLRQDLHDGARHRSGPEADADPRAQQDPGGAALWRDEVVLPQQRRRVFRLLLRLLSARSVCAAQRSVHRKNLGDQRADRPDAAFGDARAARARRRDHRRLGVLHLRHRLARGLLADGAQPAQGPAGRARAPAARPGRAAVQAQRPRLPPRHLPRARRLDRDLPGPPRGPRLAAVAVRRRDREHRRARPA